jgi:hypothetical protein
MKSRSDDFADIRQPAILAGIVHAIVGKNSGKQKSSYLRVTGAFREANALQ